MFYLPPLLSWSFMYPLESYIIANVPTHTHVNISQLGSYTYHIIYTCMYTLSKTSHIISDILPSIDIFSPRMPKKSIILPKLPVEKPIPKTWTAAGCAPYLGETRDDGIHPRWNWPFFLGGMDFQNWRDGKYQKKPVGGWWIPGLLNFSGNGSQVVEIQLIPVIRPNFFLGFQTFGFASFFSFGGGGSMLPLIFHFWRFDCCGRLLFW